MVIVAKRGSLLIGIVAGVVLVSLSVPVASAKSSAAVRLSLIPLPRSTLGSAARGLKLEDDSGVVSNLAESRHAFSGGGNFRALGRVTGYALDYGNGWSGLPGVESVWTSIDKYKNARGANRGLAFWKADDEQATLLDHGGLSVVHARVKVSAVGSARFGSLTSYSASNIEPVSTLDEWFADGRYLLDVRVAARTAATARAVAPRLAKKLDARLERAVEGRLHARSVKLPRKPKTGLPPGSPNLSAMALTTTDLGGQATLRTEFYVAEPPEPDCPLANYSVDMNPAGPYSNLSQAIEWFPSANEASFYTDEVIALETAVSPLTLDLSGVDDNARGIFLLNPSGHAGAVITLSSGQVAEVLQLSLASAVPSSEIANVAQTAAERINAVYTG